MGLWARLLDVLWKARSPRDNPDNYLGTDTLGRSHWRKRERYDAVQLVSPNTRVDLTTERAQQLQAAPRHRRMRALAEQIDHDVGMATQHHDAIGVWKDGAENSLVAYCHGKSRDRMLLSLARKARAMEQKQAGAFTADREGNDRLYIIRVDRLRLHRLRAALDARELFSTIVSVSADQYDVLIGMKAGVGHGAVVECAAEVETHVKVTRGTLEFIGDPDGTSRARAIREYDRLIADIEKQVRSAGDRRDRGAVEDRLSGDTVPGSRPSSAPPVVGDNAPRHRLLKKSFWSTPAYLDERGYVHLGRRPKPAALPPSPAPPADPPRPRIPFSQPLPPGATRIHIKGTPTAEQALILHDHLFPAAGTYLLTKASPVPTLDEGEALDRFEGWFLDALEAQTRDQFVSAEQAIWDVLDQMLMRHDVAAPSHLDSFELNRALFDLTHASTARMVGLHVPDELVKRLQKLGFSVPEALDFPALAYRMALISQRLLQQPPVAWPELVRLANAVSLSSVERAAIDLARQRAGLYLKPIFDDAGRLWTTTRELEPLRERVAHAIEHRVPVREAARLHGNAQRAEGIQRDAQRTIVTEIAEARGQAAWQALAKHAPADAQLFRQTAAHACRGCYRLLKNPDGTPRLFSRAELEAGEAQGVNRGNWREWHLRAGSIHPQCRCSPVSQYHPEMADIFADRAPTYAAEMARLKVFAEAA